MQSEQALNIQIRETNVTPDVTQGHESIADQNIPLVESRKLYFTSQAVPKRMYTIPKKKKKKPNEVVKNVRKINAEIKPPEGIFVQNPDLI